MKVKVRAIAREPCCVCLYSVCVCGQNLPFCLFVLVLVVVVIVRMGRGFLLDVDGERVLGL